ncbi:MAG TPA: hypothetical protein VFB81_10825 [Myxococcales bacterium]|nr:hypothetical protein [Myxococcales bacterium]
MSVGGIRGGGKAGGPKGPSGKGGAGGAGGAGKAGGGGGFVGKVDQSAGLVGPSGLVGSDNVGGVKGGEPLLATQAAGIAQALAHGQIKTKSEATKKFVAEVLKQKLKMQSKALTDKIAESLQDDPNFSQRLDRMWSKG